MSEITSSPATAPRISPNPSSALWVAGVRYPGGAEIWCAYRGGEEAWTTDRKLAATYSSESSAAMAARLLADGSTVPFWISADS